MQACHFRSLFSMLTELLLGNELLLFRSLNELLLPPAGDAGAGTRDVLQGRRDGEGDPQPRDQG